MSQHCPWTPEPLLAECFVRIVHLSIKVMKHELESNISCWWYKRVRWWWWKVDTRRESIRSGLFSAALQSKWNENGSKLLHRVIISDWAPGRDHSEKKPAAFCCRGNLVTLTAAFFQGFFFFFYFSFHSLSTELFLSVCGAYYSELAVKMCSDSFPPSEAWWVGTPPLLPRTDPTSLTDQKKKKALLWSPLWK